MLFPRVFKKPTLSIRKALKDLFWRDACFFSNFSRMESDISIFTSRAVLTSGSALYIQEQYASTVLSPNSGQKVHNREVAGYSMT